MRVPARKLQPKQPMIYMEFVPGLVVAGVDISLNATGLVAVCGSTSLHGDGAPRPQVLYQKLLAYPKAKGLERLEMISAGFAEFLDWLKGRALFPDVFMFEGPGFASSQAHSLGMAHGILKLDLFRRRAVNKFAIASVTPNTLKLFVAEKGHAEKNVVMKDVFKLWGYDSDDDNLCDAFACTMVGLCKYRNGTALQQKVIKGKVEVIYEGRSPELATAAARESEDRAAAKRVARAAKRERKRLRAG